MQAIHIDNLVKTYKSGVEALKGISLTVEQGDFFALLGPNGAGKSTIIGILTSLVNKTSGTVKIFNHDIDHEFNLAKTKLGVVPQEFNFNVFEKVIDVLLYQAGYYGIPRNIAKQRAEKFLKQLGLWEKRNSVSRTLSGGMKRRLMIARALIHQPELLILDEPTAGVDIEIRRSMWGFLKEINEQGTTIILTTHYLEEAENLCRNIAIINHGHVIENTSMPAILKKLDVERFVLSVKTPMYEQPSLEGFPICAFASDQFEIEVSVGRSINDLFKQLSQCGIEVSSIRNKSNRLEELFLHLTQDDRT